MHVPEEAIVKLDCTLIMVYQTIVS